jgi:hypothetical protein
MAVEPIVSEPVIAWTIRVALGLAHEPTAFAPARAPLQAELDQDNTQAIAISTPAFVDNQ